MESPRFKILSLPWFDAFGNFYRYFFNLLEICCLHFLSMQTTKLQVFMKQRIICKLWKQLSFQIPIIIEKRDYKTTPTRRRELQRFTSKGDLNTILAATGLYLLIPHSFHYSAFCESEYF